MISTKFYFHDDAAGDAAAAVVDIRRLRVPTAMTFDELVRLMCESFGADRFHAECRVSFTDEDGDAVTVRTDDDWAMCKQHVLDEMKQSTVRLHVHPPREASRTYATGAVRSLGLRTADGAPAAPAVAMPSAAVDAARSFERNMFAFIAKQFPGGRVLPYHVPHWLASAVRVTPTAGSSDPTEVDFDINVDAAFVAAQRHAIALLGADEDGGDGGDADAGEGDGDGGDGAHGRAHFLRARRRRALVLLEQLVALKPDFAISHYNRACALALLGAERCARAAYASDDEHEAAERAAHDAWLEQIAAALNAAFECGYDNVEHAQRDPDLLVVRHKTVVASVFARWQPRVRTRTVFADAYKALIGMGARVDDDKLYTLLDRHAGNVPAVAAELF